MIINFIKAVLHLIPFVHFYKPWEMSQGTFGGSERQHTFCTVCKKKMYRIVDNV